MTDITATDYTGICFHWKSMREYLDWILEKQEEDRRKEDEGMECLIHTK